MRIRLTFNVEIPNSPPTKTMHSDQYMKAFISVDMEGMPHIAIRSHLHMKDILYEEARKIATKITLTTTAEPHKNGFNAINIARVSGTKAQSTLTCTQIPAA